MHSSPYYSKFLREVSEALERVEVTGDRPSLVDPFYLLGNGGSAAVASHICNDMVKRGIPAHVPDYATMTCLANDMGWDHAFEQWLLSVQRSNSTVILISSSGRSQNIVRCANLIGRSNQIITLTGFDQDNPLRSLGNTNYYVPSPNYGVVEIAHLAILHGLFNPG